MTAPVTIGPNQQQMRLTRCQWTTASLDAAKWMIKKSSLYLMILFFNLCIRPLFLVLFPHISAEIFLKNWLTKSFKFNWMLLVGKHRHTHLLAAEIIRVQEVRIKWEYKRRLSSVKTKESTRDSVSRPHIIWLALRTHHEIKLAFACLWLPYHPESS